ncbi:MAG: class I mannose-6-phosphate isomerase [Bacteroidales bacterium]|nr:class I mannose-6-phosphate isomerase [Bacteroidales bacterium]
MGHLYPLTFQTDLHELVWGGHQLQRLKQLPLTSCLYGESWEISDMPNAESVVDRGPLAGQTLSELVAHYGAELLGGHVFRDHGRQFPLLVKFIDANACLSIQVHPGEALAQARHGKHGKAEMWYVMDAQPGSSLYVGFNTEISRDEYRRRVADGTITDVLSRFEVQPGDVFYIPPGRVHSISSGILLCEIQQSSDVTYRLYDYHRLGLDGKPRQLHIEEALDAIDFAVCDNCRTTFQPVRHGVVSLVDCRYFSVNLLAAASPLPRDLRSCDSFVTLTCISGTGRVRTRSGDMLSLGRGMSCLIPAVEADFVVEPAAGEPLKLLEAFIRPADHA